MSNEPSWEDHRAFLAVIDSGSLSGAARELGVSQPTVRVRIETLESAIGASLFTRSVHGLVPTAQAQGMVAPARAMAHAAAALMRAASASADTAAGTVRLSVSDFIGVEVLPGMLKRLYSRYPDIVIEVDLSNTSAD
ncbi:LysR family transcriptional regulator, partial [Thioclava sp. BHET1]